MHTTWDAVVGPALRWQRTLIYLFVALGLSALIIIGFRSRSRLLSRPPVDRRRASLAFDGRLFRFLYPYCWALTIATGLTLASTAVGLLSPWSLKILIDNVIGGAPLPPWLSLLDDLPPGRLALAVAGGGLVLVLVNVILDYLVTVLVGATEQRVAADMREMVFGRLHDLSLEFHDRNRTGDLVTRLSDDVSRVRDAMVAWFEQVVPDVLTLAGILALALLIDPMLALASLSVVPLLIYYAHAKRPVIRAAERTARDRQGELATLATDSLRNVRLVQAFARQGHETDRFRQQLDRTADASISSLDKSARYSPIASMVLALGTGVVSWLGALRVLEGRLSVGTLVVFLSYLGGIYGPIRSLSRLVSTFARGAASRERLAELFDEALLVRDGPGAVAANQEPTRLAVEDVSFSYGRGDTVLNRLNLVIEPGERVFIVGASGEGKSTLLSLLLRLYEPSAGTIRLGGTDLRQLTLTSLRQHIALVPQDPWIIDGTVEENIRFGNPEATRAELRYAARKALVDQFAFRLPLGFNTPVGEGGALLSGGQLRRIALARALIRDAPVLLLDEPTTGLDARSTEEVLAALDSAAAGRAVVVVSHDLKLAVRSDRIVVLQGGTVIESGTHHQLMSRAGEYSLLWATQNRWPTERTGMRPGGRRRDLPLMVSTTRTGREVR